MAGCGNHVLVSWYHTLRPSTSTPEDKTISLGASFLQVSSGCISISRDPFQWDYMLPLPGFHFSVSTPECCLVVCLWNVGSICEGLWIILWWIHQKQTPDNLVQLVVFLFPAPHLRLICIGSPRISLSLCLAFSRLSDNDFMSYLQSPLSCLKNILVGEVIPLSLGRWDGDQETSLNRVREQVHSCLNNDRSEEVFLLFWLTPCPSGCPFPLPAAFMDSHLFLQSYPIPSAQNICPAKCSI